MQIHLHADNKIDASDKLQEHTRGIVEQALKKVGGRVTRVEVHLSQGSASGPVDIKCVMEARLERRQPAAVTHHAPTIHLAIDGAAEKLQRALAAIIGKLRDDR